MKKSRHATAKKTSQPILFYPTWLAYAILALVVAWGIASSRAYYIEFPTDWSWLFRTLSDQLPFPPLPTLWQILMYIKGIVLMIAFAFGVWGIGSLILYKWRSYFDDLGELSIFAFPLGAQVLGVVIALLGALSLYKSAVFWILFAVIIGLGVFAWKLHLREFSLKASFQKLERALEPVTIIILILPLLLLSFIMVYSPEVFYDSLVYHLGIPNLYLLEGGIVDLPFMAFAKFPKLFHMLYLFALGLDQEVLAKMIHWSNIILLTAVFLRVEKKFVLPKGSALLGILFLISNPFIQMSVWTTGVDFGCGTMAFIGFYALLRYHDILLSQAANADSAHDSPKISPPPSREKTSHFSPPPSREKTSHFSPPPLRGRTKVGGNKDLLNAETIPILNKKFFWIIMAGLSIGAAASIKYQAIWPVLGGLGFIFISGLRRKVAYKELLFGLMIFGACIAICFLPWAIHNIYYTGNPFSPLLADFFGDRSVDPGRMSHDIETAAGWYPHWWQWLLFPWKYFLIMLGNHHFLSALAFALIIYIVFMPKALRPLGLIAGLTFLAGLPFTTLARYHISAFLPLGILVGAAFFNGIHRAKFGVTKILIFAVLVTPYTMSIFWNSRIMLTAYHPIKAILGRESYDEFRLSDHPTLAPFPAYRAWQFLREFIDKGDYSEDVKVMFVGDEKIYPCNVRHFYSHIGGDRTPLVEWANNANTPEDILAEIEKLGVRFMFFNIKEAYRTRSYKIFYFNDEKLPILREFWMRYAKVIEVADAVYVLEIGRDLKITPENSAPSMYDLYLDFEKRTDEYVKEQRR
ncbi:hypothetical protein ACFL6Y_09610 [Elusimicrobiota bacterium]